MSDQPLPPDWRDQRVVAGDPLQGPDGKPITIEALLLLAAAKIAEKRGRPAKLGTLTAAAGAALGTIELMLETVDP